MSVEINLKQKSKEIKMSVNNILDEKKLGSVIFISIEQYLFLVLSNPCSHYYNIVNPNYYPNRWCSKYYSAGNTGHTGPST